MRTDERHTRPALDAARGTNQKGVPGPLATEGRESLGVYFLIGLALGVIFIKSEVASWFRIQEMFRFQGFHMYGVIGSAVAVGSLGVALLKASGARSVRGEPIQFPDEEERKPRPRHALGGTTFGLGWGLVGACPGPMYALAGSGYWPMLVALASAVLGAWAYGWLRPRLPH
jgi:uncharacterized membrane protein YedE/YeeE